MHLRSATAAIIFYLSTFGFTFGACAADLRGDVTLPDGTPVCALVLANGQSMFSCQPNGPFSFTGLPVRDDGIVTLQAYAVGQLPYRIRLTDTEYQLVVMEKAESCPVNDGVSGESLNGTYKLLRASVLFDDGIVTDSADPAISVTGDLSIAQGSLEQSITIEVNGQTSRVSIASSIEDKAYVLQTRDQMTGFESTLSVLERGKKLVTALNARAFGGDYTEINYWEKLPAGGTASESQRSAAQIYAPIVPVPGGLVSELLQAAGHH